MMYTLISSLQTGLQTHCKTNAEKFIHDSITRRKQTSNARVAMTLSNAKFRNNFIALYTRISRRFRVRLKLFFDTIFGISIISIDYVIFDIGYVIV